MAVTILNIESSTKVCSVSIVVDGEVEILKESLDESYSHSEKLNVFIREAMKEIEIPMSALNALAVSKGPGSFTGLRIGVSTAKGLAYALELPLISCNSLESLASGFARDCEVDKADLIVSMIDARRKEVYMQVFNSDAIPVSDIEAKVVDADSFSDLLSKANTIHLIGDGARKFKADFANQDRVKIHASFLASASHMASLSFKSFQEKQFEDIAYFEPYYLKDFIAIKPRKIF